jgi:hypothetical protein
MPFFFGASALGANRIRKSCTETVLFPEFHELFMKTFKKYYMNMNSQYLYELNHEFQGVVHDIH